MSRVTSLTSMSEKQLNRWIKRIALLFVIVLVAFAAFYFFDRWRAPTAPIVDQQLTTLEATVLADPADISARGQLADVYTAKGRFADAIAQYTAILETGKAEEQARLGRARAYALGGDLDAAIVDYQAVVDIAVGGEMAKVDPMLQTAYYGLGDIALQQGRAQDAVGFLEKALLIKRSDADALLLIGRAYTATGQTEQAAESLRRAVSFVPIGWVEPYQAMIEAYTKAGDPAMAAWAAAMVEFQTGNVDGAVTQLETLVDGTAGADAATGLGLIAETRGNFAAAATWYQKALAINPEHDAARLGFSRVGTGEASAAPAQSPAASGAVPTVNP